MNMPVDNNLAPVAYQSQTSALVLEPASMKAIMDMARLMADGKATLPDHLRNPADCMAVIMQAMQWGMNPFAVAQKTHVVSGKLGYEAQLVNAVVTASGAIQGRFHYEYRGDGEQLECRVGAVLRGEQEITWGEWLCMKSVTTRNSPLWKVNPKQQMGYLQTKNWSRLYAPGAILGVYSTDELEPNEQAPRIEPRASDILPEIPESDFEKNFPTYRSAIEAGRKTAEVLIGTLSTKFTVTAAQQDRLRSITPIQQGEAA
jgi:hypothetical protein